MRPPNVLGALVLTSLVSACATDSPTDPVPADATLIMASIHAAPTLVVEDGRLTGIQGLELTDGPLNVTFPQGSFDDVFGGTQPTFDADQQGAAEAATAIFEAINSEGTFVDLPQNIGGCSSIEFCGIAIPFNSPYGTGLPSTPFAVDVETAFYEAGPSDGVFAQPLATNLTFDGEITFAVFGPHDPMDKNECKKSGWETFGFRNQGQCVSFVETGKDSR